MESKKTDSDVATAIRTIVVLIFAWLMVAVAGTGGTIDGIGTYCGRYTGNAFISYGAAKSSPIYGCQSGFYSLITSPILLTISSFSKGFVINFLAPVFNASISLDC